MVEDGFEQVAGFYGGEGLVDAVGGLLVGEFEDVAWAVVEGWLGRGLDLGLGC